jgi:transcriptional regulator with XRE-family HTH domain
MSRRFGSNLKKIRERAGLYQEDVARLTGMTQGNISLWESGKRLPEPDSIKRLAAVAELRTTTKELMQGVVTPYDALRGSYKVVSENREEIAVTATEGAALRRLRKLPPDIAHVILVWLDGMVEVFLRKPQLAKRLRGDSVWTR